MSTKSNSSKKSSELSEDSIDSNTPSNESISSGKFSVKSDNTTPSSISSIDLENPKGRKPFKERISELNNLINDQATISFDSDCLKKRMNWSKSKQEYNLIDNLDQANPQLILDNLKEKSPKLDSLINEIEKLDARDMKEEGTLYKHMIFTDMKTSNHGVRVIGSLLAAKGYTLGYTAKPNPKYDMDSDDVDEDENPNNKTKKKKKKEKKFNKITMLSHDELMKTKDKNFYILSSVSVFDQPLSVDAKKTILSNFNERPTNIHGKNVRFIIMDSGFKEGIDIYDIKYIHIFEPQTTLADKKQVIGRGTRTCGQKGLRFHPTKGWPLHVQIYDLSIPEELQDYFGGMENMFDLYMKTLNIDLRLYNFVGDIEEMTIKGSVDYDLNKNIHEFQVNGGGKLSSIQDIHTDALNPALGLAMAERLLEQQLRLEPKQELSNDDMRKYINETFAEHKWPKAKMENRCVTKGGSNLLTYTPTQAFIKDYFTPQAHTKGMLLWHSTGSGKTCSAVATATNEFEKQDYTILWVTRTTLKNDIWKNMFDMVCHEVLRSKISEEGLVIPSKQPKRMKLLSKSWRIRPMSYKQFSNLVSKKNNYYDKLVNINGEHDPLKKTLIIIDEAHKLYGGGDLSSIERPDMKALHKSLMHSYAVSGDDSVKLLLMTATPITTDPMEMVKLVNLCKPIEKQIPTHFDDFTKKYLNPDTIKFTPSGAKQYKDDIVGIVSYLNREKDARQFAQPVIKEIKTPLVNMQDVYDYDLRILRNEAKLNIAPFMKRIEQIKELFKGELGDLDPNKFKVLIDACNENPYIEINKKIADKYNKACHRISKKYMRNVTNKAKQQVKKIRGMIKDIQSEINELKENKKNDVLEIKEFINNNPEKWRNFKESSYYAIRYKCGKNVKSNESFDKMIKNHMDIIPFLEAMHDSDEKIDELKENLKIQIESYRSRVNELKSMIKNDDLNNLEKSVVRSTIKERQKLNSKIIRKLRNFTKKNIRSIEKEKRYITIDKNKTMKRLKKELNEELKKEKSLEKNFIKESKQMKKIMRKVGDYTDEIKNEMLLSFVNEAKVDLKAEIDTEKKAFDNMVDKEEKKEEKRLEKLRIKEEKLRERELQYAERERIKEEKRLEKLRIKEEKQRERQLEKERKQAEKEARKTRKKR